MSPVTDELETEFAVAASRNKTADLFVLGEKLSIETTTNCVFGVKANCFDKSLKQTEFCRVVHRFFVWTAFDLFKMIMIQLPFVLKIVHWLKLDLNKPYETKYVLKTMEDRRRAGIQRNDVFGFMEKALRKKEREIGDKVRESYRLTFMFYQLYPQVSLFLDSC